VGFSRTEIISKPQNPLFAGNGRGSYKGQETRLDPEVVDALLDHLDDALELRR
jgi:hypothetical protein